VAAGIGSDMITDNEADGLRNHVDRWAWYVAHYINEYLYKVGQPRCADKIVALSANFPTLRFCVCRQGNHRGLDRRFRIIGIGDRLNERLVCFLALDRISLCDVEDVGDLE